MKLKNISPISLLLTTATALALGAGMVPAQAEEAAPSRPPVEVKDAKLTTDILNVTLKVVSVDADKHNIVLKSPSGSTLNMSVRASVPLDRVKAGDDVDVTFVVSKLVALTGSDKGMRKSELTQMRMADGSMNSVSLAETYSVFAVDKANQKVQLHDAHDQLTWLTVSNPNVFKDVKVGNKVRVVVSLTEVADLKPAAAKAAAPAAAAPAPAKAH